MTFGRACSSCGQPLTPHARFCPRCGIPAPPLPTVAAGEPSPTHAAPSPVSPGAPPLSQPAAAPVAGVVTVPGSFVVPPGYALVSARQTPGAATAALVLGILSWVLMLVFIGVLTGFVTAPLAVAFGVVGRQAVDADPERFDGKGRATAGLWLGLTWLLGATLILTVVIAGRIF